MSIFMHSVTQLHTWNSSNSVQKGTWHFPFVHLESLLKTWYHKHKKMKAKKLQSLKALVYAHVLTYFPVGALLYKKVNLVKAVRNRLVRTLQITAVLGLLFCCFRSTTETITKKYFSETCTKLCPNCSFGHMLLHNVQVNPYNFFLQKLSYN